MVVSISLSLKRAAQGRALLVETFTASATAVSRVSSSGVTHNEVACQRISYCPFFLTMLSLLEPCAGACVSVKRDQ